MDVDGVSSLPEDRLEEPPDEPAAENDDLAARNTLCPAENTGERLGIGSEDDVHAVRKLDPAAPRGCALGKPAGLDGGGRELLTGGLVPCSAALAFSARKVMYERDAAAVGKLCRHLVPEHGSLRGAPDLLDIAAAEAARKHTDDVLASRFGHDGELRLPAGIEDDGAHGGVS
jgi:hypothetical protein